VKSSEMTPGMKVYVQDWLGWHPAVIVAPKVYRSPFAKRPFVLLAMPSKTDPIEWTPRLEPPRQVKTVAQYEANEVERLALNERRQVLRSAREEAQVAAQVAAHKLRRAGFVVRYTSVDGLIPQVTLDVRTLPSEGLLLIPETLVVPEGTSTEDFLAELRAAFALGIVEKP